ncbi:MAG TPA: chemotaxis protein [Janthinobacterium sp.]|nr:chemotaxis protein [Janthinobacterium sp.]
MKTPHYGAWILAAAFAIAPAAQAGGGATPLGSIERGEAKSAAALLESAVAYLKRHGERQAYAAFNKRDGAFVHGPYYVYVVGLDGIMLANGGAPDVLSGSNALELRDAAGKPLVRALLDAAAAKDSGSIEYRWLNRADNRIEDKTASYRKVGKEVVVVGYYTPHATPEQAREMLERAVAKLKSEGGGAAFKAFNDPRGGFVQGDLYVFAVGLEDGKYRASGASPRQTGQNASELHDAAGKALMRDMIVLAKEKGGGEVDYVWRNPATNGVEAKHSLIERVGDVLLGVGYYVR